MRLTDPSPIGQRNEALWGTDLVVAACLFLMVFGSGVVHIQSFPPLFFDEGWTVCVARTWVESGHYGCLLRGEPAPPSLAAHFPVVASVAASFALFGVGVWQTRVVGLLYTFAALLLLYAVARRLFGRLVAIASLALLILVPLKWSIHPLYLGRQVLGEMPLLCFLLAGFVCFLRSAHRPLWLVAAIGCWSLAFMTKAQVAPFLIASFVGTIVILTLRRNWSAVRQLALVLIGSWAGFRFLIEAKNWLLSGHTMAHPSTDGMTEAIALVFVPAIRLETIQYLFVAWAEYPLGLAYAAWRLHRTPASRDEESVAQTAQIMLLLLAGSWLAWFAFLSAGEPRYALPGLFLSAPFAALFVCEATRGFDVRYLLRTLAELVPGRRVTPQGLKAAVVVVLLAIMGWGAVQERYAFRAREDDRDLFAVTQHLNTTTSPTALIETYDSELFLFLNRPYTYALPKHLVEIIRREQGQAQAVTYDPLQQNPDYLVVGEYGRWAGFYKPLIAQNRVRLVTTIGRYQIYEPVRS
ncbi:MAG TPA: glycosyltransferase family 39 protein [Nitrospira sp.]|nr:glycosyltransferase family 39 protein [Nitrospira sp.]